MLKLLSNQNKYLQNSQKKKTKKLSKEKQSIKTKNYY